MRERGAFGLIATNTIAQGDTRASGLRWICRHGADIFAVRRRVNWPGLAAVVVSVLHISKGRVTERKQIDGRNVDQITAFLFHRGGHDDPARLAENAGGSFVGSKIYGQGFTFDDTDKKGIASPLAEMRRLFHKDARNRKVVFPYIGGEEVNTSPTHAHHRYVINFKDYPLCRTEMLSFEPAVQVRSETPAGGCAEASIWLTASREQRRELLRTGRVPPDYREPVAADWPDLLAIVEERVKPEREKLGDNADARRRKHKWWLWGRYTRSLFRSVAGLNRVLAVNCGATPHLAIAFLPASTVFAHSLNIFPYESYSAFGILQSRLHETWARFFGSSMKDDLRYTPSDCFETFPFPDAWRTYPDLETAGEACHAFRADLMLRYSMGLTKTYNRFHDPHDDAPDIATLRRLHAALDRAVLDAYGWRDVPTDCEFLLDYPTDDAASGARKKPSYRYRWPDDARDEVFARLLELNAERAAAESRSGRCSSSGRRGDDGSARGAG